MIEALALPLLAGPPWPDGGWLLAGLLFGRPLPPDERLVDRRIRLHDGRELQTADIIHRYPGKRVLLNGVLGDVEVVAKFYLGRFAGWREWSRGLRGSRALQDSGVPAPAVLHAAYAAPAHAWLTVLERIHIDEPWPPRGRVDDRLNLRMVETLLQHHRNGIIQNDLNWANFLPQRGTLYSIDGDRVHRFRAPLSRRRTLANLVRFYGYKTMFDERQILAGHAHYCRLRGWSTDDTERDRLLRAIHLARRNTAGRVAARSLRGWKHYRQQRRGGRRSIADRRRLPPMLQPTLLDLPARMADARPASVGYTLDVEGRPVRVRRTPPDTIVDFLLTPLRGSRALRTWARAVLLRRLRIPIEEPLAVVEIPAGRVRRDGYLLQKAGDTLPLTDAWRSWTADQREALLRELGGILRRLRCARLSHRRLDPDAWGVRNRRIILLDIDGLRCHPRLSPGLDARWRRHLRRLRNGLVREAGVPRETVEQCLAWQAVVAQGVAGNSDNGRQGRAEDVRPPGD